MTLEPTKPHIFKVRWGWASVEEHDGIQSSWLVPTFQDLCAVLKRTTAQQTGEPR